ncbi:hypothetical protein DFJ74DRAFT_518141, partial [Hyaloraphidium curvatum]
MRGGGGWLGPAVIIWGIAELLTGNLGRACPEPGCSSSFERRYDLERHSWVHRADRPFTCNDCGKAFIRQDYLNKHPCPGPLAPEQAGKRRRKSAPAGRSPAGLSPASGSASPPVRPAAIAKPGLAQAASAFTSRATLFDGPADDGEEEGSSDVDDDGEVEYDAEMDEREGARMEVVEVERTEDYSRRASLEPSDKQAFDPRRGIPAPALPTPQPISTPRDLPTSHLPAIRLPSPEIAIAPRSRASSTARSPLQDFLLFEPPVPTDFPALLGTPHPRTRSASGSPLAAPQGDHPHDAMACAARAR